MNTKRRYLSTGLLTLSIVTLLAGCGGNTNSSEVAVTDNGLTSSTTQASTLTQGDLKILGEAYSNEANSYYRSEESSSSVSGLSANYTKVLGHIGDLGAQFSDLASCSTLTSGNGTNELIIDCLGVKGSIKGSFNMASFGFDQVLDLEVKGADGEASLKHTYHTSMFSSESTRSINDILNFDGHELEIEGTGKFTRGSDNGVVLSGTYEVKKDSGAAETVAMSSEGLKSGACGLNSGTVTFTSTSGLVHTVTLPSCVAVTTPPPVIPLPVVIPALGSSETE